MATWILLIAWIVFVIIGLFVKSAKPFAVALFLTAVFSGVVGGVLSLIMFYVYASSAGKNDISLITNIIYWVSLVLFGVWRFMKALDANKPKRPVAARTPTPPTQ